MGLFGAEENILSATETYCQLSGQPGKYPMEGRDSWTTEAEAHRHPLSLRQECRK